MKWLVAIALLCGATALAQTPTVPLIAPQAPQAAQPAQPQEVKVRVLAVEGTKEGKSAPDFESGLEGLAPVVSHLPYDTYRKVMSDEQSIALGGSARFALNPTYTLEVSPAEQTPEGFTKVNCQVLQPHKGSGAEVKAIGATAMLPAQGALKLEGLYTDKGEMVVLVQLMQDGKDSKNGNNSQQNQDQQKKDQQKQDQQQAEKQDQKDQQQQSQQGEQEKQQDQQKAEQKEAEKQPDRQNLEAILQSLENQDKRELKDAVNDRTDIGLRGDHWW